MFRILNNHCRSGVQQKVLFFLVLGHLVSRADRLTFLLCRSSLFRLWVSLTIVNLRLTSLLSIRPAIGNSRLRCQLHLPLCVYIWPPSLASPLYSSGRCLLCLSPMSNVVWFRQGGQCPSLLSLLVVASFQCHKLCVWGRRNR